MNNLEKSKNMAFFGTKEEQKSKSRQNHILYCIQFLVYNIMAIIQQSLSIGCKNFCLWEKMQKKFSANEKKKTLTIYKRTCEKCGNLTEGSQMKNSDKENLGR